MVRATVLYIEDNVVNANLVIKQLMPENILVLLAEDGRSGIQSAHAHQPDLILMDFALPDMNGVEVMRQLKRNPNTAHTPVIMLTVDTSDETRAYAYEVGCDDYLNKPISKRDLLHVLERYIGSGVA